MIKIKVLGIEIGTATDWDELDNVLSIQFYNANIANNIFDKDVPKDAIFAMYLDEGIFQYYIGEDAFDVKIDKEKIARFL